jgi:hypothetical protein
MFAYEQQKKVDDENAPYYLECLQGIAHGRHSEELQTKVAIEASSGHFSTADIRNAYQSFNLSIHDPNLSDTHIIGLYTSRLQDSPKQEGMLRNALALIGRNRNSDRLREVAAEGLFLAFSLSFSFTSLSTPIYSTKAKDVALNTKANNKKEKSEAKLASACRDHHLPPCAQVP